MATIQFYFGATRNLVYNIGDKVAWGYNEEGQPGIPSVKVYGVLQDEICPVCGKINENQDYDVFLEYDVIKKIEKMADIRDYDNDHQYKVLKDK
jgi:hypothetical protein